MKVPVAVLLLTLAVLTVGWSTGHRAAAPTAEHSAALPADNDDFDGMAHNPRRPVVHTAATTKAQKTAGLNCVSACSDYEQTINQYFTDVAAAGAANATDNVYSVATQYSDIKYDSTFDADTNAYVDGNPYPTTNTCSDGIDKYCVTDTRLQTEIGKVISDHGWPKYSKTALYFIFTPANVGVCIYPRGANHSNFCTTNTFCAYHSWTATKSFIYAVEPDAAAVSDGACDATDSLHNLQTPAGNGADATINTISHEHNEAITDPFGTAWWSDDSEDENPEMADLCAYDFGTPLGGDPGAQYNQVINGHHYFLQLEYSNADGGCVPYLGGPITAPDPLDGIVDGIGPLVYDDADNGPVMTTNTVYAIYWIPQAPANTALPKVTGTSKVGKKLTATRGAWSHAPASYAYRWLRCSAAGTSCKAIAGATKSTYTLVKADAGHRLEVRVTATNMAGSKSAASAAGHAVKK